MRNLILCAIFFSVFASVSFADYTRVVRDNFMIKTTNAALGASASKVLSNNVTGSITIKSVPTDQVDAEVFIEIDTLGDTATGNLETVSGTVEGDIVYIQTEVASQDVTVIETGNLKLGATRVLTNPSDMLVLLNYDGTNLKEIGFFDND